MPGIVILNLLRSFVLLVCAISGSHELYCRSAFAQDIEANVRLLPGDAFFHTYLTEELSEQLSSNEGDALLTYYQPPETGGLGLIAGYSDLVVTDVSPSVRRGIAASYRHLRTSGYPKELMEVVANNGKRKLVETNPFHLFVYPNKSNFSHQRLAIKYNDTWRRMHYNGRPAAKYVTFIPTGEAVAEDWRNCGVFVPLNFRAIDESRDPLCFGEPINGKAVVAMDEAMFVILAENAIEPYFLQMPSVRWVEIDASGAVSVKEFDQARKTRALSGESAELMDAVRLHENDNGSGANGT